MILILTYHKVLLQPEPKDGFYTVKAEDFHRQLERLTQSGLEPLAPAGLPDYRPSNRPSYVLSFDDGTVDHFEVVLPALARHNCRAIFFVPTAKLNRPGYLTTAQLREINAAGHTLGLHSHDHIRLDRLAAEEIRTQMSQSREILADLVGAPSAIFAPPGGFMDQKVRDIALEMGVKVIRTMRWGYNRQPDLAALDCVPLNRYSGDRAFERILRFENHAVLYAAKEMTKRLIPERMYTILRDGVSRLSRRG